MGEMQPGRDLGPCSLTWKGVDLGENLSATFRHSSTPASVNEASKGVTPVDKIFVGDECTLEVICTRMGLATLTSLLAGASGSGTSGTQMVVKSSVGKSMYDRSGLLIVKPMVGPIPTTDTDDWLTIFRASPEPEIETVYDEKSQRGWKFKFTGFPCQTETSGGPYVGWLWGMGWTEPA